MSDVRDAAFGAAKDLLPLHREATTEQLLALAFLRGVTWACEDDLYRAGIRPSQRGDADKATVTAMAEHLKDLRAICFKKLGIEP